MVSLERKVSPFAFSSILCRGEKLLFLLCSHTFSIFHTISSTTFSSFSGNPQVKGILPWQTGKMETGGG